MSNKLVLSPTQIAVLKGHVIAIKEYLTATYEGEVFSSFSFEANGAHVSFLTNAELMYEYEYIDKNSAYKDNALLSNPDGMYGLIRNWPLIKDAIETEVRAQQCQREHAVKLIHEFQI